MVDKLRKIFVVFAIVAVAVMGMPVNPAKAVTVSAGDLIKASGPAVYYYASNGKRYVFPTEKTYRTWYADFSTVKVITDAELASIQIGGNIVYRPGTRLAKITTDPKTYAIGPKGVLHWITSESVAISMYGSTWATMIDDIPDAFFTNYTYGSDIVSAQHPDSTLVKYAGSNDIYVLEDGEKRLIANEAAFTANMFMDSFVRTIADSITYPTASTGVSVAETRFTDVAQLWGSTIVPVTGDLTVSVSSATPATFEAPRGGVGIEVAKFNFTAGSSAVTLNGLTITREGLGYTSDIDRVYLYNGANKLTSGRTLSATTHTAVFTNLGLNVAANSTVTLTVKVDTSSIATGGSHRMVIDGVGDVSADATVGGVFPISGNTFTISSGVNVGIADVESNGTGYTRKVGEANVEVANFSVHVDNTENAQLEAITLYNSGRDILSNLKLYRGTTLLATASANGDYFTFSLNTPYEIAKGESAQFTVKGDISGRDGDTATLSVRYKTDVRIKGLTYGYPLSLDVAVGDDALNSYIDELDATPLSNMTTAEAGQITASFNGPVASDVAKNTNDVVLMNFALTAQADVDVEKTTINISGNANLLASDVEDLELVCNDVVVTNWSTVTIGNNASTDYWTLPAGGLNCVVRIDITNSAAGDETILATLKDMDQLSGFWVFKDADTGDTLTDIVPTGDIAGNVMDVTVATLNVDLASSPSTGNIYVPRTADAEMVAFLLTAGAATDVKVTNIKLAAYLDDDQDWNDATDFNQSSMAKDVLSYVELYDEAGNQIGGTKSLSVGTADITATFDNLGLVIPAGTTEKVLVKAKISSTAPKSAADDFVAFALSSITAEYGNSGTTLAATIDADNSGSAGTPPSVYQTVTTNGDLTVSLHADSPVARLIPMNASGLNVLRIKLAASKEDVVLNELAIEHNPYVAAAFNEIASATIGSNTAYFVDTDTDADTFKDARIARFTNLNITVPADSSTYVDVLVRTNDNNSAQNYNNVLSLANSFSVFTTNYYKHTTVTSGVVDSTITGGAASNSMYVFEAYPSFAISETNGSLSLSTWLKVGTFTITANGGKDVTFTNAASNFITATINAAGLDGLAANVKFVADGNDLCTIVGGAAADGSNLVTCDFATNPLTVAKNSSKTVHVYVDTMTALLGDDEGDAVSVSLDAGANNVDWSIDDDGQNWTDVAGTEITDILFSGNLVGGTYSR